MATTSLKLALVGNPNAGKSSVFNRLTGLNQKVGNFPGVTVDSKTGVFSLPDHRKVEVMDLPGTYSLHPSSTDEAVVLEQLLVHGQQFDLVLYVADMTNLERHLLLFSQVADLGLPLALCLTMPDLAEEQGLKVDTAALSKKLDTPVFCINGRSGSGVEALKTFLQEAPTKPLAPFIDWKRYCSAALMQEIQAAVAVKTPFAAVLALQYPHLFPPQQQALEQVAAKHQLKSLNMQVDETMSRFDKIVPLVKSVSQSKAQAERNVFTSKLDRVLTHEVWGTLIFLGILMLIFQSIFAWASYPMDAIELGFSHLSNWVSQALPAGALNDLLVNGILAGLSGVLVFVPQIALLFLLIGFLENVGYMARAVYLSDNLMRRFGLNGRSIVSLFSGMACAVPSIMAARTISNQKERLITIMVTPFISCSARIPVYTVLVALLVPDDAKLGWFNQQGLIMLALYLLGVVAALVAAYIMKKLVHSREQGFLILELPAFKKPDWKSIGISAWEKVYIFVYEAGRIILAISIILWLLSSYSLPGRMEGAEGQATIEARLQNLTETQTDDLIQARKLEASFAGMLGKSIEPVIRPLGFDWKIGIALITSFAAREVFVGTMATLYSVGSQGEDYEVVQDRLRNERNLETGLPVFTPAVTLSLLLFYVFAMQCISTIAVVKRETGSWKWAGLQVFYMTGLAYLAAWIAKLCMG
jgi:ferrous iron transport protein B